MIPYVDDAVDSTGACCVFLCGIIAETQRCDGFREKVSGCAPYFLPAIRSRLFYILTATYNFKLLKCKRS